MSEVVLSDSCYCSPIGNRREEVLASLREGRSGIVSLGDGVIPTGAIIQPSPHHQDETPIHPRFSPRYQRVINGFCESLGQMLERRGRPDVVFWIGKRPFFSKWPHRDCLDFDETRFPFDLLGRAGLNWPSESLVTLQAACSTGLISLNLALRQLRLGRARRILLVAVQTELNPEKFVSFKKLGALSPESDPQRSCRPFWKERSGLVAGEIAVAAYLEARTPEPGEILLWGGVSNCDASRLTDALDSGQYLQDCLTRTLARWSPDELDFLCPHATSTPLNDRIEGETLERVFSRRQRPLPVVPLKQYFGHTLVSSGVWETVLTAEMMRENFLAPLLHSEDLETFPHLDFPTATRFLPLRRALKLAVGFGGINSALLLEKAP